jgi:starch-binding outer membrane protein, SusD/RagB family
MRNQMKNRNKIKVLIGCFSFATILFASCEGILEQQPYSQIAEEQFWTKPSDAVSGVAAIYDGMQRTYSSKYLPWGEFRADNFVRNSVSIPGNSLELLNNTLSASNSQVLRWDEFYKMIARANLAIENIPKISGANRSLLAEAHAIRAYAYFHAIRVWGGVPLYTEAVKGLGDNLYRPRTSADEIMTKVILPDLQQAEALMVVNADPYRFSKGSVWSLQAEVYMWLKDYPKAKVALDKIRTSGSYSLTNTRETWARMFINEFGERQPVKTMAGPELIFSIKYELTDATASQDRSPVNSTYFSGIPPFYIAARLENKWLARFPTDSAAWVRLYPNFPLRKDATNRNFFGDWRQTESREIAQPIGGNVRLAKFRKNQVNANDDTDVHVFRYANTILLLAEAENQLGNTSVALGYLNQVRTARQLPTVPANSPEVATKAALENLILEERQYELLGEGVRWWDLRRTGKAVEIMNPINGQTEQKLLFPIFDRHLIDNSLLKQTEGY